MSSFFYAFTIENPSVPGLRSYHYISTLQSVGTSRSGPGNNTSPVALSHTERMRYLNLSHFGMLAHTYAVVTVHKAILK